MDNKQASQRYMSILAENIDYNFILQLSGIISGAIALIKFMDHQYKSKLKKDTTTALNTNDIDHLEEELRMITKELTNTKSDIFEKINNHEKFADDVIRELKADIIKLIHDLASLEGQFKTYKEMDNHKG